MLQAGSDIVGRAQRDHLAVLVGAVFGFLLMLTSALRGIAKARSRPAPFAGVLQLTPGASEWRPVERSWKDVARPSREHPPHPTLPDTFWHALPDGTWLTVKEGDCAPTLEPGKEKLPPIPRCDPAKFHYRLDAATRLGDSSLLIAMWHDVDETSRAWRLAPGAAEWKETAPVPMSVVSSKLETDGARSALLVGPGSETALYDGEAWRRLPDLPGGRIGWKAVLASDGSVFATDGIENPTHVGRTAQYVATTLIVLALAGSWWFWGLSPLWLALGLGLGVVLAVVSFFALWIGIGARI